MISTNSLLRGLAVLLSIDIVMTLVMVGYMGATELNMLADMVGFSGFVTIKIVASAVAVYVIYRYCIPSAPFMARYCIVLLGVVYTAVCVSNTYQVVGAVA